MTSLRVGPPVEVGEYTLVPVVEIRAAADAYDDACWMLGSSIPIAVVLLGPGAARLIEIQQNSGLTVEGLEREHGELARLASRKLV